MNFLNAFEFLLASLLLTLYFGIIIRLILDKGADLNSIYYAVVGMTLLIIITLTLPVFLLIFPFIAPRLHKDFQIDKIEKRKYYSDVFSNPISLIRDYFNFLSEMYEEILVGLKKNHQILKSKLSNKNGIKLIKIFDILRQDGLSFFLSKTNISHTLRL